MNRALAGILCTLISALGVALTTASARADQPGRLERLPAVPVRDYAVVQASAQQAVSHRRARVELEPIGPGLDDPSGGMSLAEVTALALGNSPTIRQAQADLAAAQGRAFQASRYPNPTFGSASPQLAGNQSQYNAYFIQDFVTKGKIRLSTAAAERAAREAGFALTRARFDVLTNVRRTFYVALAMQRRVEILESMVQIARTAHEVSEKLWKAEVGARGDVLLLQIELSKAEAELKNARILAETSRRQLAAATGLFELVIDRVSGDLAAPLPDYELLAVQQGVIERNALVDQAAVGIARAQFQLRRAEVEPFPNVNVMGGFQNQQPGALAPESQGIFQIQMVVPLWNLNRGNIQAAQAEVGAAVANLSEVRNDLASRAAQAIGRYLTARQLTERYEQEILPSAIELQNISARLYQEGQIEFLKYLASQRALVDANLAYIDAQEARWTAAAETAGLLQSEEFP